MAHHHVRGYMSTPECEVVACADIVDENRSAFADEYSIAATYSDYNEMLATEKPDIVSICTWPHLHAEMVINAANAGVKAVHCEKPMADTLGDARRMKQSCEENDVQLTFNHQNRFEGRWNTALKLLQDGEIGELRSMEGHWGNILDTGTHWLDLFNMYNGETPVDWVMAQIHRHSDAKAFGARVENQALVQVHYTNQVQGLLVMGEDNTIWAEHRLWGTEGLIEVDWPQVRVRGKGDRGWRILDGEATDGCVAAGIADLAKSLKSGSEPILSAKKAYAATEVIFAAYESSRRRGRVELPLDIDDNPLHQMIDAGLVASG